MRERPGMIPETIIQTIKATGNVVLFTHVHPDGDALGSLLGMAELLEDFGKNVFCYVDEPISHLYDFLPACARANSNFLDYEVFVADAGPDVMAIALDCGDDDRLGKYKEQFLQIKPFVVIDHHLSHRNFGTCRWIDPTCSSTGEMVYELSVALGAGVNFKSAYNLYVAICTDTGSFRYDCTGSRTLHIAAELVEKGVKPAEIGSHLYDNYSQERLKLMELVLATMTLCESQQIAFMSVSQQMLKESGATMHDVEGFIDFARSLSSVKVAAFIKEGTNGQIAVSMRAKGHCDVAAIAKRFNGGGHRNAAGFRVLESTIEQVSTQVRREISKELACR